ncbi:MAG TPA: hypothetical protein EYO75_06985 [Sulfurimonas sp.]|nr:hypothetical protein [Sulfurimonas sp.]HIM75749.1 hypothetical protein [Campylobacterales bacterium]
MNDYKYSIIDIIKEGFVLSNGAKKTFNLALGLLFIIAFAIAMAILLSMPELVNLINLIVSIILLPVSVGLVLLAVNRARGKEIKVSEIFSHFGAMPMLIGAYLLVTLFTILGFIALVIPGIYLGVTYSFTLVLVADKKIGIWEAMELSRKTITEQWFKFFGLALLSSLILLISAIPLGIGLIWTIPAIYLSYGLIYHRLFDEEA